MLLRTASATEEKLDLLTESARYDVCLASCSSNGSGGTGRIRDPADPLGKWIYPARIPGAGEVGILKVLQSNVCRNCCSYCRLAAVRDSVRRVTFEPWELARVFMEFVSAGLCRGIFISSGVCGTPDLSMTRMVETASILREYYHFGGYIHLKILPESSYGLIEAAARYANRLSINLEAPTPEHLSVIAPNKDFIGGIVKRMSWTKRILAAGGRTSSYTTQFVVGASGERDIDILKTADWVYRDLSVFRSYFSAYQESEGKGDRVLAAVSMAREHRLYQCDFLLRGYGFRLPDLVFTREGDIPSSVDPKTAYALMHPEGYPVEVTTASAAALLRVPGIGPVSAARIEGARRSGQIRTAADLRRMGVWIGRALPYIEIGGKRPGGRFDELLQRRLFEEDSPDGWITGTVPLGKREGSAGFRYPGQRGKRINYVWRSTDTAVYCREPDSYDTDGGPFTEQRIAVSGNQEGPVA